MCIRDRFTPPSAAPGTTYYRVLVNAANSDCQQAVSSMVTAIINPDLLVTTQPNDIIECDAGAEVLVIQVSGGSGAVTYQWQFSPNGTDSWSDISGAEATTYQPLSASPGTFYYRALINAANDGCDQAVSNVASVDIEEDPSVFDSADDNEICEGGFTVLHNEVVGGTGINAYQWQQLITGVWVNIPGAVGADYTTDVLLACLLYTSPSPRDRTRSRMPSSA